MNPLENEDLEDSDIEINKDVKESKPRKPYTLKKPYENTEARAASFAKAKAAREENIAKRKLEKEQQDFEEKQLKQQKIIKTADKIKKSQEKVDKIIDKVADPVKRKNKRVILVSDTSDDEIEIVKKEKPKRQLQETQPPLVNAPPKKKPVNFV